jgi:hypothetical protein
MLLALLTTAAAVHGAQVISAADPAFVRPLGRAFPSQGGLGLSWLGGGLHVSHSGTVLRATVLAHPSRPFKFATYESTQGNDPWQGVVIIPATAANETFVASAGGAGEVKVVINVPPDYWANGADSAVILTLESDGAFNPAPPAPSRVLHVLGDSITAATNVRGGFPHCADGGLYADYSSSWAGILCAFFGASCSTVAVGGKGLVKNCCDAGTTVPQYYTQLKKNDPDHTFDFQDAPPQGVLVYLGTNVRVAQKTPPLKSAHTHTHAPPPSPLSPLPRSHLNAAHSGLLSRRLPRAGCRVHGGLPFPHEKCFNLLLWHARGAPEHHLFRHSGPHEPNAALLCSAGSGGAGHRSGLSRGPR